MVITNMNKHSNSLVNQTPTSKHHRTCSTHAQTPSIRIGQHETHGQIKTCRLVSDQEGEEPPTCCSRLWILTSWHFSWLFNWEITKKVRYNNHIKLELSSSQVYNIMVWNSKFVWTHFFLTNWCPSNNCFKIQIPNN